MIKIWELEGENNRIRKLILGFSIGLTMFIIQFCTENNIDCADILLYFNINIEIAWLKSLLQSIFLWILYSVLFYFFYFVGWFGYSAWWAYYKHREIYLQGEWLTIHDKESAKIGVAEIKQSFYDISVEAINVRPNSNDTTTTSWRYIGASFYPDENDSNTKLIGTYYAQRQNEASKQGVHVFREFERPKNKTIKMSGFFGDVLKLEKNRSLDEFDKTGDVMFFRMSPAIKKYISFRSVKEFDSQKLRMIVHEQSLQNEPFVIDLKKVLCRNYINQTERALNKKISEKYNVSESPSDKLIHQIRKTLLLVLRSMADSDRNLSESELETINKITGLNWTMDDIRSLKKIKDKEVVKTAITDTLNAISEAQIDNSAVNVFKELLLYVCDAVIESDGRIIHCEESYKQEIRSWLAE